MKKSFVIAASICWTEREVVEDFPMGPAGKRVCWELWRQDDNGNRVLVASFEERDAALNALAKFESHHHKQTYWIEEKKRA